MERCSYGSVPFMGLRRATRASGSLQHWPARTMGIVTRRLKRTRLLAELLLFGFSCHSRVDLLDRAGRLSPGLLTTLRLSGWNIRKRVGLSHDWLIRKWSATTQAKWGYPMRARTEGSSSTNPGDFAKPASIRSLYQWLKGGTEDPSPPNAVERADSISSGDASGLGAGKKFATAANAVAASAARQRAQGLTTTRPMSEHESYMHTAAQLALSRPSQPFAALLVDRSSGEIIGQGLNATNANPLAHGEIACINNAAASFNRFDWSNTTLYTTAEPCCMCQSAILWCGISEVVFGTSIATLTSLGWDQFTLDSHDVTGAAPFAECSVLGGVLESHCDALFTVAAELRRSRMQLDR